jgi:hypothetical protein
MSDGVSDAGASLPRRARLAMWTIRNSIWLPNDALESVLRLESRRVMSSACEIDIDCSL